jgi:hypothetical protein
LLREAEERGERYASLNFRLLTSYYYRYLINDEPEEAARQAHELLRQWGRDEDDIQRYYAFTAFAEAALYVGDGHRAWDEVNRYWPGLHKAGVFYLCFARVFGGYIRAKCAIVKAGQAGLSDRERSKLLKEAMKIAAALDKEPYPYARGLALLLRASVAAGRRDRVSAIDLLQSAIGVLAATDMIPWRVSAEYRYGQLVGDSAAMAEAAKWMRAQDCRCPERLISVFLAGEWESVAIVA